METYGQDKLSSFGPAEPDYSFFDVTKADQVYRRLRHKLDGTAYNSLGQVSINHLNRFFPGVSTGDIGPPE